MVGTFIIYLTWQVCMGLFGRLKKSKKVDDDNHNSKNDRNNNTANKTSSKKDVNTKCKECGLELHFAKRLEKHMKKAHGNVPEKKFDPNSAGGDGTW